MVLFVSSLLRSLHPSTKHSLRAGRLYSLEVLEARQMLAADWQNPINHLDVDGRDGPDPVTPLDALIVINELSARRHSDAATGILPDLEPGMQPPPYLDVNGNGFLSPLDALMVINGLPRSLPPLENDNGAPDNVLAGTRAALANGVTSDSRVNTETRRSQSFPDVAAGSNQLIVTWSSWDQDGSDWGIFAQRYDAAGEKLGSEFRVNTTTRLGQRESRVAVDSQGRFVVLWQSLNQDGGSWGVYARVFDADANPLSAEILVNTGTTTGSQIHPDVAFLSNGQFAVTWEGRGAGDNAGIFAKILNFDGSSATSSFLVNSTTTGNQSHPRVTSTTTGFAIAWDGRGIGDNSGVFMRAFANTGAPLTGEILVNTRTQGLAKNPSISFLGDQLLVAWQEDSEIGWGVRAQRFTAAGARVGTTIVVNQTQRFLQIGPDITHLREGGFVVTWFGTGIGDGLGIFSRRFAANGTAEQGETLVNSTTECLQFMPAVTAFNNGFVVAWQGNGEGDKHGIYARFFETDPLVAPQLAEIADRSANELTTISLIATASDSDTPSDQLRFSLDAAPTGATIDPISGAFNWSPSEADGPGSFTVTVRVRELNDSTFFDTESFTITVLEVNQAPDMANIPDQTAMEGTLVTFQASATDADLPANQLSFSLTNPPDGATIDPATGIFSWTPNESFGGNTVPISILVSDNGSPALSDSITVNITVNEVNEAPALDAISDQTIDELMELSIDANATDPDGDALIFELETAPSGAMIDGSTGQITWTPTEADGPGTFTFIVRVREVGSGNLADTETFSVEVAEVNSPPQLIAIDDQTATEFQLFTIDVAATDNDLPAQALTFSLESSPPGATISSTGRIEWTPDENFGGTSPTFVVRVTDDGSPSLFAEETFLVSVSEANSPPVIQAIDDQAIDEFELLEIDVIASDSDTPVQTLTFSLDEAPAGATITSAGRFSFTPTELQGGQTLTVIVRVTDSGSPSQFDTEEFTITVAEVNSAPSITRMELLRDTGLSDTDKLTSDPTIVVDVSDDTGIAELELAVDGSTAFDIFPMVGDVNLNGTLTITQAMLEQALGAALTPGQHTISLLPRDNLGLAATAASALIFTYIPTNSPPVWSDISSQTGVVDSSFSLDLSAFASDPDIGDILLYSARESVNTELPLWLSIDPLTGLLSGTPTVEDVGTVTIEVMLTDHSGLMATETFDLTITPANTPPQVNPIPDQQVDVDASFTLDLDTFFSDPDVGTMLAFSLNQATGQALPAFLTFESATNILSGTPGATDAGRYAIRARATDPQGLFVEDIFLLDVGPGNKPPIIVPFSSQLVDVGDSFSLGVLPNVLEADAGDTVTLTLTLSPGDPLPAWLAFDPATGIISGTPAATDLGTLLLVLSAQDSAANSTETLIEVSVQQVNDPPTLTATITDQLATEDAPFLLNLAGSFTDSDPDDSLTLSVTLPNGEPLPEWLDFNPTSNELSGTPSANDVGQFFVKVTATDESSAEASDTFLLVVANANDSPVLTKSIPDQTVDQGGSFVLGSAGFFSDPDPNDHLQFTAELVGGNPLPAWLVMNPTQGLLSGTPSQSDVGTISIRITATDGDGLAVSDEFDLVVNDVNLAPTASDISRSIPVTSSNGLVIGTIQPMDPDLTDTFTFSIVSGNDAGAFALNTTTGEITLVDSTLLAAGQSYHLVIRVTDSGTPARTVDVKAMIEVSAARDPVRVVEPWETRVDSALLELWGFFDD